MYTMKFDYDMGDGWTTAMEGTATKKRERKAVQSK